MNKDSVFKFMAVHAMILVLDSEELSKLLFYFIPETFFDCFLMLLVLMDPVNPIFCWVRLTMAIYLTHFVNSLKESFLLLIDCPVDSEIC